MDRFFSSPACFTLTTQLLVSKEESYIPPTDPFIHPQGADRMTLERVARFYLNEFQVSYRTIATTTAARLSG